MTTTAAFEAERPRNGDAQPRKGGAKAFVVAAALAVAVAAAAAVVLDDADASSRAALGPGSVTVDVGIEHSRFSLPGLGELRVRRGTTVRFVVRNDDPIAHELIVGGADVHERHRNGTERAHAPVDGEVSVAARETATTSYTFTEEGTVVFACHLPRHEDYGMRGEVAVVR